MGPSFPKPWGCRAAAAVACAGVAIVAGCVATAGPSAADRPAPGTLVVSINTGPDDDVTVEGWTVAEKDLPVFVGRRRATAVIIRGNRGTRYDRAMRIEAELRTIGIENVTIMPIGQ